MHTHTSSRHITPHTHTTHIGSMHREMCLYVWSSWTSHCVNSMIWCMGHSKPPFLNQLLAKLHYLWVVWLWLNVWSECGSPYVGHEGSALFKVSASSHASRYSSFYTCTYQYCASLHSLLPCTLYTPVLYYSHACTVAVHTHTMACILPCTILLHSLHTCTILLTPHILVLWLYTIWEGLFVHNICTGLFP